MPSEFITLTTLAGYRVSLAHYQITFVEGATMADGSPMTFVRTDKAAVWVREAHDEVLELIDNVNKPEARQPIGDVFAEVM